MLSHEGDAHRVRSFFILSISVSVMSSHSTSARVLNHIPVNYINAPPFSHRMDVRDLHKAHRATFVIDRALDAIPFRAIGLHVRERKQQ